MHTTSSFELLSADELRARSGRKWHEYAADVLPAWVAEMDFGVPEPIRDALRRITDEASYGYEASSLYPNLAAAFAEYMQRRFGWLPNGDRVVPVADLVQALFTAVSAFTEAGQGVVLQTPIYPPFQNAVRETGRRTVWNPLTDTGSSFSVDTAHLAEVFDADAPLLLLCNPHNPTGRVLDREELEAIAGLAVERDLVVVADEVHADLVYPGQTHIPFASLSPEAAARTVTLTSATKAYNIPGLRCGLMHFGSDSLRERFRGAFPDRLLGIVNRFGIEATIVAWRECGAWLDDAMRILNMNRLRLTEFLTAELPQIGYYAPEATYLAWLDCRSLGLGDQSPHRYLLGRASVGLSDGADFGPGGEGRVRLNFGTSPEILDDILTRIAKSVPPQ
jgi:cysteine-S-conjugate beta-lyase